MFNFLSKNYCSIFDVPTSKSLFGEFWKGMFSIWVEFWPFIITFISIIIISELLTRHNNQYNSANGFTPDFNRLVGSFSYILLQLLLYFVIYLLMGNIAYCLPWPYIAHIFVFSINFTLLHKIGFWPEKPKKYRRKYKRRR